MISFQNPLAFLFLLLIPLLYILRYFKIFEQIKFYAVLKDWDGSKFEWSGKWYNFLYIFSKVVTILGCICVVVAMADPVKKTQEKVGSTYQYLEAIEQISKLEGVQALMPLTIVE